MHVGMEDVEIDHVRMPRVYRGETGGQYGLMFTVLFLFLLAFTASLSHFKEEQSTRPDPMSTSAPVVTTPISPELRVCIVQYDNRPSIMRNKDGPHPYKWLPMGANDQRLPYWTMSYVINFAYALQHGYEYLMTEGSGPCFNLKHTWCKVRAMQLAKQARPDTDYFIYLDSDSFFPNQTLRFSDFLMHIDPSATLTVLSESYDECIRPDRTPRALSPVECRANSGVQIWKNDPHKMDEILDYWWGLSTSDGDSAYFQYNWGFEQSVLSRWVVDRFPNDIQIVNGEHDPLFNAPNGWYIQHFWGSPDAWPKRVPTFVHRFRELINSGFWANRHRCHNMRSFPVSIECQLSRKRWPDKDTDEQSLVVESIRNVMPFIPFLLQDHPGGDFREFAHTETMLSN